ncbi:hypothetical protein ACJMK2_038875 [Sinanodonta woodiana]|uniref:Uncharacterized protein n=1 Tax=Sinanodonta woodiana TaxID=1069815 RepID=A0ABD3WDL7_SINWO
MKYLAVLLGLVCLVCSQEEDMGTVRDEMINTFTAELTKRGLNAVKAAETATSIVNNNEDWEYLLDDRYVLGTGFLSDDHINDVLEMFLSSEVQATLTDGNDVVVPANQNENKDE